MFKRFLSKVLTWQKWETVCITQDIEKYARVRGKLIENNIAARTKFVNQKISNWGGTGYRQSARMLTTYEILVKKEDFDKVQQVIH
jgi:hypothetical protein